MSEVVQPAQGKEKKRVIVLPPQGEKKERIPKGMIIGLSAFVVLSIGLALGYRASQTLFPAEIAHDGAPSLTERVRGGIYALELERPEGKARWMLEFDAEIVTKDGPSNPLELRNALEKLVIEATSLPLVQTSQDPAAMTRISMLEMSKQEFPWLVDVYLTRSDIRGRDNRLEAVGEAMRGL